MNEEEKKALKVINARTRRLLDELEIEKEDMLDEPKIAYLMQEIRANKTVLNLIEKLQKDNEELKKSKITYERVRDIQEKNKNIVDKEYISKQKVKDKIEKEIKYHEKNILDIENITIFKSKTAKEEAEIEFNKYAIVVLNKMLQELIKEREEK